MPAVQKEWTSAMPQIFARFQLQTDESYLRLKFDFIVRLIARDDAAENDISQTVACVDGLRHPINKRWFVSSSAIGKLADASPVFHVATTSPLSRLITATCREFGTLTKIRLPFFSNSKASG